MDTSKAIELIEKSEHIAILLSAEPDLDSYASAEVLASALKHRQKLIGFLASISTQGEMAPIFPTLFSSPLLPREFIVSLDTSSSPISQLRYEKAEGKVDVIFSPKGQSLSQDALSFREGKTLCDCVIALGVQNIEASTISPDILGETPIINIDVSGENAQYGEVNLVNPEKSSYAEMAYDLLTDLSEEPLPKDSATLLLAALLFKTNNFFSNTTADTLLAGSELLRLEADLAKAQTLARDSKSPSLLQLQGRAMVRSKFDEKKGVLWSFVTAEDFEKTGRTPADIPSLLGHMRHEFPPHQITALLCQSEAEGSVSAILAGNGKILGALESRGAGKFQSPYLRISSSFESFREAEEIIGSLLEVSLLSENPASR